MKSEIQIRISSVKSSYGITNQMLANEAGVSLQTAINQTTGKFEPNLVLLSALIRLAPSVDVRWLITGEGQDERLARIELDIINLKKEIENLKTLKTIVTR